MSRYKIGDKVKIRSDLESGVYYNGVDAADDMEDYMGTIVTIVSVDNRRVHGLGDIYADIYHIEEDGTEWNWTEDMFDYNYRTECCDCGCCNTCNKGICQYGY